MTKIDGVFLVSFALVLKKTSWYRRRYSRPLRVKLLTLVLSVSSPGNITSLCCCVWNSCPSTCRWPTQGERGPQFWALRVGPSGTCSSDSSTLMYQTPYNRSAVKHWASVRFSCTFSALYANLVSLTLVIGFAHFQNNLNMFTFTIYI